MLLGSLIAALLLAVGLAIFDIIIREVSFATVVRDSNYAIYAADTGAECAQYWDYKCGGPVCSAARGTSLFATSSGSIALPASGATCDGQDIIAGSGSCTGAAGTLGCPWSIASNASSATTTFTLYVVAGGQPPYCAEIIVGKSNIPGTTRFATTIISNGYNTCDANNPNRIEREFVFYY